MERWAEFSAPLSHDNEVTGSFIAFEPSPSILACVTVSLPVTTTVVLISGACCRQRKGLYTACRQITCVYCLCRCLALVSLRFARGQGEEQEERQQVWCRSADGADGGGTAHGYLKRVEWESMFLGCKHTTDTVTSYPKEGKNCFPLLHWQGDRHDTS